jgi:uncharacterized repeat protein (TIGR03806 family)
MIDSACRPPKSAAAHEGPFPSEPIIVPMLRISRPPAPVLILVTVSCSSLFAAAAQADGFTRDADGTLKRLPWTGSRVVGSPEPPPPYRVTRAFPQLELDQPIYIRAEPGTNRMVLVAHSGKGSGPSRIYTFDDDEHVTSKQVFLDLDRLIYGFAFHPRYEQNGYLFVMNNGPTEAENKQNRISRFTVDRQAPHNIVPGSELVILEWDSNGHNGGDLAFGPDGFLYCPTGDGTSDSDTLVTGQGLNDLLAVLIRIDVDHPSGDRPYSVPSDNPFVNVPGARPEIWACGFRNPWRIDYDHKLNQVWIAQNGQDLWEQVFLVRRGDNYGWSTYEGSHPFYLERPLGPQPHVLPTAEHHHSEARSLTGGIVYWGPGLPELHGTYLYGDYSTGKIWGIRHDGARVTFHQELTDTTLQIAGFGEDHAGELLIVDHGSGLYRLEPTPPQPQTTAFPQRLSETGLFVDVKTHHFRPGVLPYTVNAPLWSDGAHKERWLAIPGDGRITYKRTRGWEFPEGSVLVKSFALEREAGRPESQRWIETRLLTRQQGEWVGYSYLWNDEQTDAELVGRSGRDIEFAIRDAAAEGGARRQLWHYPSRAECMVCHSRAANFVLGLTEHQMNRDHDYGGFRMNQLELLERLGMFDKELPERPADLDRLVDPSDPAADLGLRARSYLHANCSICHVEAGGGNSAMDLEINAEADEVRVIDARPVHTTFGIEDARIVAPGRPDRSVLLYRMERRGHGQMPPLASSLVDSRAVSLLRAWIEQLPAADD